MFLSTCALGFASVAYVCYSWKRAGFAILEIAILWWAVIPPLATAMEGVVETLVQRGARSGLNVVFVWAALLLIGVGFPFLSGLLMMRASRRNEAAEQSKR